MDPSGSGTLFSESSCMLTQLFFAADLFVHYVRDEEISSPGHHRGQGRVAQQDQSAGVC
jgi:hypothetical protein